MAAAMIGVSYSYSDLTRLPWRSYIIRKPRSAQFKDNLVQKLQQYDKPFLLFQHDVKEQTEEKHYCSHVDHYHLLTANGNPSTGSDATYCYIKRMAKNFDTGYDCQPVRFFNNLMQYL